MPRWCHLAAWGALVAVGCSRPAEPAPRPGDVVRPEVSFAPADPWPVGADATVGVLLRVERAGADGFYVMDGDVPDGVDMRVRVRFLDGGREVGEPLDVPLVRDC